MIILIESSGLPPGGLIFEDPRVRGKLWNDTSAFLEDRATEVIKFRMANPEIYNPDKDRDFFDREKVKQEIVQYNYHRLGGNERWFINQEPTTRKPSWFQALPTSKRCDCGVEFEERLCTSCVGRKVIGYRCPKCGGLFDV
jgi:hypothetical protein